MPPPIPKPLSLTLILAATPSLGIGKNGALPWPMLKKEMAYFARVTKRVPPAQPSQSTPDALKRVNAVIMGRKTWESIPPKLRPLKDRLNVVLTKDVAKVECGAGGPVVFSDITQAISYLRSEDVATKGVQVERAFVIGGASVYSQALELPETDKVLLTKITQEFECDSHFSLDLDEEKSWRLATRERLQEYVGEEIQEGGIEEQGVGFEFLLYEKVDESVA
jgi:dihydrofolate reductase